MLGWETISQEWSARDRLLVSTALTVMLYGPRLSRKKREMIARFNKSVCTETSQVLEQIRPSLMSFIDGHDFDHCSRRISGNCVAERRHDHSRVIHGRSHQTDRYPDGCLVHPNYQLGS